jgi:serine/threonine protein kinase
MLRPRGWRNQVVGHGAFGIVYKATWGSREVAVKEIILPQEPHNPTAAAKRLLQDNVRKIKADFVKEAKISGKHSHHPNLVRLLGWADDPNLYLVQEFLHGQSLHSQLYVEGWQPKPADVLKVALDVANGMTHLHDTFDTPVIHRDLKSANLMLTTPPADPSFAVKITDFGLTRESHVESAMTASTVGHGGAAGTVLWMAPELVLGEDSYDEKVDVFSYAMCLIELVNQEKPWAGSKVRQETISVHLVQGKRPTHQLRRANSQLQLLISDCWSGDASTRPPFSEIAARVEAMRRGETSGSQEPEADPVPVLESMPEAVGASRPASPGGAE